MPESLLLASDPFGDQPLSDWSRYIIAALLSPEYPLYRAGLNVTDDLERALPEASGEKTSGTPIILQPVGCKKILPHPRGDSDFVIRKVPKRRRQVAHYGFSVRPQRHKNHLQEMVAGNGMVLFSVPF